MRSRGSGGFQTLTGIVQGTGYNTSLFTFGQTGGGWRLRRNDGSNFFFANIGGDDALSGAAHRIYDHRFTYDFVNDLGRWEVSRQVGSGGDGLYSTITTFTSADLHVNGNPTQDLSIPANWQGVFGRFVTSSDHLSSFTIHATAVPEPGTYALLGIFLAFGARFARRSQHPR